MPPDENILLAVFVFTYSFVLIGVTKQVFFLNGAGAFRSI